MARPTREELRADNDRHFEPTRMQFDHENGARGNRELWANVNHGRPAIAATARPGEFHGPHAVPARDMGRDNRAMNNRDMNRNVPRPENARNMDRPMRGNDRNMDRNMRQDTRNDARNMDRGRPENVNRGGEQRNAPRPDNRMENRGGAPRPTAFHPENNRGHESAPRQEKQEHGHK
jgi:hypothetical protein